MNPGDRDYARKMKELFSQRTDCVDYGSKLGCFGAHVAMFDMEEKEESESSLHLSSGFLRQNSGKHEAMVEQNQALCTRRNDQEMTFSPRASAAVAMDSCHLQMVSEGLPQEGELKKGHGSEGLLPWATQHSCHGKGRPHKKQTEFAALTIKD